MKRFKDGDSVRDKKFNEVFIYNDKTDGYAVRNEPERFEKINVINTAR